MNSEDNPLLHSLLCSNTKQQQRELSHKCMVSPQIGVKTVTSDNDIDNNRKMSLKDCH